MVIEGWTETVRDESPDGMPVSWKQNVVEITLSANTHVETAGDKIRLIEEVFDNDQN